MFLHERLCISQVMSVDQIDRESTLLQNLKEWNPVNAG